MKLRNLTNHSDAKQLTIHLVFVSLIMIIASSIFSVHHADSFLTSIPLSNQENRYSIQTFGGSTIASMTPTELPKNASVLVLPNHFTESEWQEVKSIVRGLTVLKNQLNSFRLHVLVDGNLKSWAIFPDTIDDVLNNIKWRPSNHPETLTVGSSISLEELAAFYLELGENLPNPHSFWETLILLAPEKSMENQDLNSYCSAYLINKLIKNGFRMIHWKLTDSSLSSDEESESKENLVSNTDDKDSSRRILKLATEFTCGETVTTISEFNQLLLKRSCIEVSMPEIPLPKGILQYNARLIDRTDGNTITKIPAITQKANKEIASPVEYSVGLKELNNARQAVAVKDRQALRSSIRKALNLNPLHPSTLKFAAGVYQQQRNWKTALQLITPLVTLTPEDPEVFTNVGDLYFQLEQWEKSVQAYQKVLDLDPTRSMVTEKIIGVQEARGDILGALNKTQSALKQYPNQAHLHIRRGSLLQKSGRPSESINSYRKALNLNPRLGEGYLGLAKVYLSKDQRTLALEIIRKAVDLVSSDPKIYVRFANFCESQGFEDQALIFYQKASQADPGLAKAYYGIASIQTAQGNSKEALDTVKIGLQQDSGSFDLYQLQWKLLDEGNEIFSMRTSVEKAAKIFQGDPRALTKLAGVRDVFGDHASETYESLIASLEKGSVDQKQLELLMERGLVVALRDGDRPRASSFAKKLINLGREDIPFIEQVANKTNKSSTVNVPGGINGLAQAAGMKEGIPEDSFVKEYTAALTRRTHGDAGKGYIQMIRHYFNTVADLRSLARSRNSQFQILLKTDNASNVNKTQKVLNLLGWNLNQQDGRIYLKLGTDELSALKQTFLSALGVDELQMKLSLEAGDSYQISIADQNVPINFNENYWLRRFFSRPYQTGGLLQGFLSNIPAARLYAGLASMNEEARRLVVESYQSHELLDKFTDTIFRFGSGLSANEGQLLLPGGLDSIPAWEFLVGSNPKRPRGFLRTLLSRDFGKLLAYYQCLINLPANKQAFFTRYPSRLAAFYDVFPFRGPNQPKRRVVGSRNYFKDLARELPLDPKGRVLFPGSAQIWSVSPASTNNLQNIPKLAEPNSKTVTPTEEDKILINLILTENQVGTRVTKQVEAFLTMVHLERHWQKILDEPTAVLLIQNYPEYRELFPYLSSLPQQSKNQLTYFFRAIKNLEELENARLNDSLGLFHGFLQTFVLLYENQVLTDTKTTTIIETFFREFSQAKNDRQFTEASIKIFKFLGQLLPTSKSDLENSSSNAQTASLFGPNTFGLDDQIMTAFSGQSGKVDFLSIKQTETLESDLIKRRGIEEVLKLQRIFSFTGLIRFYDAALSIKKNGKQSLEAVEVFTRGLFDLQKTEQQLQSQLTNAQRKTVRMISPPDKTSRWIRRLRGSKNGSELTSFSTTTFTSPLTKEELSTLVDEVLSSLSKDLKDTVVGWIYAYYFSPQDLVIAEDPLLIRKHQFFVPSSRGKGVFWPAASRQTLRLQTGNFIRGPLSQLPTLAGEIGLVKAEAGESIGTDPVVEGFAAAQLAGVRVIPWSNLNPLSIHLVGLKLRMAQEFVVTAALYEQRKNHLAKAVKGLIGPLRKAQLLDSLSKRNVEKALSLLSSSDLYFLANYLLEHKNISLTKGPVSKAIERIIKLVPPKQDQLFVGSESGHYSYCIMIPPAPYENYENSLLTRHLSRRLGHIMLTLAEQADRLGLSTTALALLSEPAVKHVALNAKMNNSADWKGALDSMSTIPLNNLLKELIEQTPNY